MIYLLSRLTTEKILQMLMQNYLYLYDTFDFIWIDLQWFLTVSCKNTYLFQLKHIAVMSYGCGNPVTSKMVD